MNINPDAFEIRAWCMGNPRPSSIKCVLPNGDEEIIEMRQGFTWVQLAESICALAPDSLTALDKEGKILRATRVSELGGKKRDNTPIEVPAALHTDPETARITHFANLIHRAYEHTTNIAFDKLLAIVDRIDSRSDAIERRLERTERQYYRTLQDQVDDAFERAEEAGKQAGIDAGTDPQAAMMNAFLAGFAQSKTPATNGSNGK